MSEHISCHATTGYGVCWIPVVHCTACGHITGYCGEHYTPIVCRECHADTCERCQDNHECISSFAAEALAAYKAIVAKYKKEMP